MSHPKISLHRVLSPIKAQRLRKLYKGSGAEFVNLPSAKKYLLWGERYFAIRNEVGKTVGAVGLNVKAREFVKMFIVPNERGKGYAKQALALIEAKARKMGWKSARVEVDKGNNQTQRILEKQGWRKTGEFTGTRSGRPIEYFGYEKTL